MRRVLMSLLSLSILTGALAVPARAETLLVAQTGLINGKQSFVIPLQLDTPGELNVRVTDLGWLGRLTDLSFSLSAADGSLKKSTTALALNSSPAAQPSSSLLMYEISQPGSYYGYLSGAATSVYNMGLYSLSIGLASLDAPVPLPAGAWLLLSGLGLATAWKKRILAR